MAVTIDASVGGASSNSFVLLSEFAAYMEGRLNSTAFDSATTDTKNRSLVEATRELSAMDGWCGTKASSTQSLAWPRQWAVDPDSPSGWYFDSNVVPQRVKDAAMELAFQFINAGTTDLASFDANQFVVEKTVDVLTTRWAEPGQRPSGLRRFQRVWKYIAPLMESSGSQIDIVRG